MDKVDNNDDLGMVQDLTQAVTNTKAPHVNWRSIVCSDDNGCMVCTGNLYNPLQSTSCKCPIKPSNNLALRVVFMNQVYFDKMHLRLIGKINRDEWEKWIRNKFYCHYPNFGPPNFSVLSSDTIRHRVRSCMEEVCKKHDLPYLVFDESVKRYVLTASCGFETHNTLSPYEKRVIKMVQELASALEELALERDDRTQQLNAKKASLAGCEEMMGLRAPFNGRSALEFATPPRVSSSASASSQQNNREEDEATSAFNGPPVSAMLRTYNNLRSSTDVSGSPPTDPNNKKSIGVKRSGSYRAQENDEMSSILRDIVGDPKERKRRIAIEETKATAMEAHMTLMGNMMKQQQEGFFMMMHYMMNGRAIEGGALPNIYHPPQGQHFLTPPPSTHTFSNSNHSSSNHSSSLTSTNSNSFTKSSPSLSMIHYPSMNDEEN